MRTRKTDVVYKYGQMDLDMMDFGETGWQMAMGGLCTPKVMSMKVNGQKTRPMAMVFTLISTAADTKDNGTRINNMVLESSSGLMVPNMKVNMNRE